MIAGTIKGRLGNPTYTNVNFFLVINKKSLDYKHHLVHICNEFITHYDPN